ncbi:four helix bundle protein [Candidatus Gottesmanbacteria bacterium]|nr:four helix bundle protein [Candidatus Gottesmanbacteria bacterium]
MRESQGNDQGKYRGKINPKRFRAGYEFLLAWKITVPIYDYTVVFCQRCQSRDYPEFPNLSSYRTYDQMIQAARSGTTNIAEGNQQASLEGHIKLTGVNRASLEELLKDFLAFARQNRITIWSKEKANREIAEIDKIWDILKKTPTLPDFPDFPDLPQTPEIAVNLMVTLINQAIFLQKRLQDSLEQKFVSSGGFRENLFRKRLEFKIAKEI